MTPTSWWGPVLDVTCAMHHSVLLTILGGTDAVAVAGVTEATHGHRIHLGVAVLHSADEPTTRTHAEPHGG